MRIIISGGTGLIGLPFARMMQARGNDVILLSRNPAHYTVPASIQIIAWDGKSGDGWAHLIDAQTTLVNLAGENPAAGRWTDAHQARVLQSRLDAANAMIDATGRAEHPPHALLQASAVGWYGNQGDTMLDESVTAAGDIWRAQVCVEWEDAITPIREMGIRVVIMRIGIVLDRGGGAFPPFVWAARFFGRRLGDGRQYIPWVHNDDIAHQMRFLVDDETLHGVFNLVAPTPVTNAAFLQTLTHIMGRAPIFPVPAWALQLAMGDMATTVLDSQRILPQRLMNAGYAFKYAQLDDALRALIK